MSNEKAGKDAVPQSLSTGLQLHSDDEFIDKHLQRTSRTFALAIPLLSAERRRQVGLSYLLFRVADSIEDAPSQDVALKQSLLFSLQQHFTARLQINSPAEHHATGNPDRISGSIHIKDANYQLFDQSSAERDLMACDLVNSRALHGLWESGSDTDQLLTEFPRLWSIFLRLPSDIAGVIASALTSTISGMIRFIEASRDFPNQIQIQTVADLRLYCYAVAGIVGELLTDLFTLHHPPGLTEYQELRRLSVGFGEFLQLINILKDSIQDASDGRVFIPCEVSRESVQELAIAGQNDAVMYIRHLERADFPRDIIAYCRFLYLLADRSLVALREGGAGSKVTREEVQQMLSDVRSESFTLPG